MKLSELTDYDPQSVIPEADGMRRVYITGNSALPVEIPTDLLGNPFGVPQSVEEVPIEQPSRGSVLANSILGKLFGENKIVDVGEPLIPDGGQFSKGGKGFNNIFGLDNEPRYKLWPEKVITEGLTSAGDIVKVNPYPEGSEEGDWYEDQRSKGMVKAAQAISALAGTGGLAGADATLGATPFLRPALKHKDRMYKGKPGQEHQDIIPDSLYQDFQKKAMSGEDLAEYNFGFINDKGHFLTREDALKYGIDTGLIDPHAGKFGALTTTLMADSSKPGTAIEAMAKTAQPFYSALEHNVSAIPQAKMTGDQWLGTLSNKKGVKPEELDWTGLKGFLEENKGKPVTKAQIEEHLASNKVELKEVNKTDKINIDPVVKYLHDSMGPATKHITDAASIADARKFNSHFRETTKGMSDEEVLAAARKSETYEGVGDSKYHDYQLPGGENYREMLLTLPKKPLPVDDFAKQLYDQWGKKGGDKEWGQLSTAEKQPYLDNAQRNGYLNTGENNYKSSHWDEPNILAHVRMNDRFMEGTVKSKQELANEFRAKYGDNFSDHLTPQERTWYEGGHAPDAKKSLHLEEIQSDWHQQGRDKGYQVTKAGKAYDDYLADLKTRIKDDTLKVAKEHGIADDRAQFLASEALRKMQPHEMAKYFDEVPKMKELWDAKVSGEKGVPDAPFKKSWHELALKRMIREAAEKGYDRLSWTSGEHHPTNPKNLKQSGPEADKADKGMQGFYNDILPKTVEKLGKEHGVKVKAHEVETNPKGWRITPPSETVSGKWMVKSNDYNSKGWHFDTKAEAEANLAQNIAGERGAKKIHYIDIPKSLKDTAIGKGFPLFSNKYMFTPVDYEPEFK